MPSLAETVAALEALAPLRYAGAWDNVGLLVEPLTPRPIQTVHLTIDLTEPVYAEAAAAGAELIVAYHPPLFGGLKRLSPQLPLTRTLMRAWARRSASSRRPASTSLMVISLHPGRRMVPARPEGQISRRSRDRRG
jgi:hypothetical protein